MNMLRLIAGLLVFFGMIFVFQNCSDPVLAPSNASVIQGRIVDSISLRPVEGALVSSISFPESATTDAQGQFSLEINLTDSSTILVRLTITKSGFEASAVTVAIKQGEVSTVPETPITQINASTGASGFASNVVLVDIQASSIFVKGSGANETSNLVFEVRDSTGTPIDLAHQEKVCFLVASGPNGGEFVAPDSILTDNNGRVRTAVNSGTIAGTVQIIAEVIGRTVFSEPIPIAITGWLPDAAHFSVVSDQLNFAGYNIFGLTNMITAFVGDKFSNPVPPNTAVQFQSTGGIVAGSSVTDNLGRSSVTLLSASPQPSGINFGALRVLNPASLPAYFNEPGFALLTAQSVDENQQFIYAETVVLFSGRTQISAVSPTTFNLGPDQFLDFTFTVSDQNRNPLVAGTQIVVSSNNGDVTGDNQVILDDTQSRGETFFAFRLSNSKPDEIEGTSTTVSITVSSPNGDASFDIFGTMTRI